MKSREEEIKRSANNNFEYLYVLNERKFNEIDEKIKECLNLPPYEREESKIKIEKEYGIKINKKQINKVLLLSDISLYTSKNIAEDKKDGIWMVAMVDGIIKDHEIFENKCYLETYDKKIVFEKATDMFPFFKNSQLEDINQRTGFCHSFSKQCAMIFEEKNFPCNVVTGEVTGFSEDCKYIHTWIEFTSDRDWVLDCTINAVMNKDAYYYLNGIDKVISKITSKDIVEDDKILSKLEFGGKKIDLKTYLTCRDEIMEVLRKNKEFFEEER